MYATPRMLAAAVTMGSLTIRIWSFDGHRPMGYVNPPGRSTKAAGGTTNNRPHIASLLLSSRGLRNGPDHWSRGGIGRTRPVSVGERMGGHFPPRFCLFGDARDKKEARISSPRSGAFWTLSRGAEGERVG
ncbi:hypothetical protein B0J13DRAFT_645239 [Dactylonectria estremocensis]|uniref:Uncharacterized protein n=1 Tax=Dactylonectria estremocensis TaxID=1079267 RepID=A0A9P9E2A6_9HYPO|nr:hypothetical protein B0J13DRAFT_645239 [Dactylonectria estremocensis]